MGQMLCFIDESGHPHSHDAATRPVVVCVCIDEYDCRDISGQIHGLKRRLLGQARERMEIKANELLNRPTFRRIPEKREFVEAFFDLCRNLPITIFAVIMERPLQPLLQDHPHLPNQFRYLLQRIDIFLEGKDDMAILLFDGDASQRGQLGLKFESFLHRSSEGRALSKIADAPFFVDSKVTPGIQIADMAASAIRIYEQNALFRGLPPSDLFFSAVRRYYNILDQKTVNLTSYEGYPRPGFYRMPERHHYLPASIEGSIEEVIDEDVEEALSEEET